MDARSTMAARVAELEQLARAESLALPFPVEVIALLEQLGFAVDLQTGELVDERTPAGTPTAHAEFRQAYEKALATGRQYEQTGDRRVFGV